MERNQGNKSLLRGSLLIVSKPLSRAASLKLLIGGQKNAPLRIVRASYAGKTVIRAGEVVQEVHDGDQKAQSLDWVLIDIFPPFYADMITTAFRSEVFGRSGWINWQPREVPSQRSTKSPS